MRSYAFAITVLVVLAAATQADADVALEPHTYHEEFDTRELAAWAAYPLWQDTAYNVNMRVNAMMPGDPNLSIEHTVTPYADSDAYAGAQKLLDMYLAPGSVVSLRYNIKTDLSPEYLKIRFAAGEHGKVDYTIPSPQQNGWRAIRFSYRDLIVQNPSLAGMDYLRIHAVAVLAKIPDADPEHVIRLGIDDVVIDAMRKTVFRFDEPEMHHLPEWKPYIPAKHYHSGETFFLRGTWPLDADRVTLDIVNFTRREERVLSTSLRRNGDSWEGDIPLSMPGGLYLATLRARDNREGEISDTEFTILVAPRDPGGNHPRLLFDEREKDRIMERLRSERFAGTLESMVASARAGREKGPLDKVEYTMDELEEESEMARGSTGFEFWTGSPNHGAGIVNPNVDAAFFAGDTEARDYVRRLVLELCQWPSWVHPWYERRGRHMYYQPAVGGSSIARAYDLLYDTFTPEERRTIRRALVRNLVIPTHRGYVVDNLITEHGSNWIGMLFKGTMSAMISMYGDDPDLGCMEPWFTGAIFKTWAHISTMGPEGSYGEPNNYLMSAMHGIGFYGPSLYLNFNIDMSDPVENVNNERIWAGIVRKKWNFYFGDSGLDMRPAGNFSWFAYHTKNPRLAWFIDHLSGSSSREHPSDSFIFPIADLPKQSPYGENPVRVFRWDGTTVFKSGWDEDDFVFVMRTGPFVNHQHHDQGSFWLADRGEIFVKERTGSSYYRDPLYQSSFIQPVAHSTILIDHNPQSQRIGDPRNFAPGFDDHAFVRMFLDGEHAAYSSGDIGRLYWDTVSSLRRNVLYLKPRTLLMIDTAIPPDDEDVDVTLLYQADLLKYIESGHDHSTVSRDGRALTIHHLHPADRLVERVETPLYLRKAREKDPEKEGMLTVTARTDGSPLLMANILSTVPQDEIAITGSNGSFITGTADGTRFAFPVMPGMTYTVDGITTDALALTWTGDTVFAADATTLSRHGRILLDSPQPMACEVSGNGVGGFCLHSECGGITVKFGVDSMPRRVVQNGADASFRYDASAGTAEVDLSAGEGMIAF